MTDIIVEQVSVRCLTAYCPVCEDGKIVPFMRARETPAPAVAAVATLESYRVAEAAVEEWKTEHVQEHAAAALEAV